MAREKETTIGSFFRELIHPDVYKRSQGLMVRRATFVALAATVLLGAARLIVLSEGSSPTMRYLPALLVSAIGLWVSFRVVNVPRFADFLIAVEAEMSKVSWPDRGMLFRSSIVVLVTIFLLATVLFLYDLFWRFLLSWLGVS
jgi:preprotein translocase subunit SecE